VPAVRRKFHLSLCAKSEPLLVYAAETMLAFRLRVVDLVICLMWAASGLPL
jgi:hypothetical protein